jgi:hypothetical protein
MCIVSCAGYLAFSNCYFSFTSELLLVILSRTPPFPKQGKGTLELGRLNELMGYKRSYLRAKSHHLREEEEGGIELIKKKKKKREGHI